MTQLYAVRIDRTLQQFKWDCDRRDFCKARGQELDEHTAKRLKDFAEGALSPVYAYHSGGKGNGAMGGLYEKKQLNRIIGRYEAGVAVAVPVSFGYTQATADYNASEAHILEHARNHGVDNWGGWGDWDNCSECEGEDDE